MDSRTRILHAALDLFAEKGKHGTRMEDIALRAEVNKSMVYYYYSSKENLYQQVINHVVYQIQQRISTRETEIEQTSHDPVEKLVRFVRLQFEARAAHRSWPKIIIDVLNNEPERWKAAVQQAVDTHKLPAQDPFLIHLEQEMDSEVFRKVDFKQLYISILGLNMIYYLAKPIAETLCDLQVDDETDFLMRREESIVDLLLHGILKTQSTPKPENSQWAA